MIKSWLVALAVCATAAACAHAGPAGAAPTCQGDSAENVVAVNVDHGFRNYFLNIGKPWFKSSSVPIQDGPYCGTADRVQLAAKAAADQKRFYVLLMAFPRTPTRAQWNARFEPLVDVAISCEEDIIAINGLRVPNGDPVPARQLKWLRAIRNLPFGSDVNKVPGY